MITEPVTESRQVEGHRRGRQRTARRGTILAAVLLGPVAVLSAGCSSTPSATSAAPVNACSLLSTSEAAVLIGARPVAARPSYSTMQSGCYYSARTGGGVLLTSVAWSKQQLADFRKAHGLVTDSSSTATPSATSTTTVSGARVEVDGTAAFWLSPLPVTGPGSIPNLSQLSATKNGYVVGLQGTGLDLTQATGVFRTMLSHL